ncbi:MAG: YfcE family phosphodiesterase [Bacillus subtilis]|nr:YfcE family phosphodiesterase [Bacillus subtilis]
MKLVVVSDNHRNFEVLEWIVSTNPNADHYIHLGDSELSESTLSQLGFYGVHGNYPFEPKFPMDLVMEYQGVRTFLTHGHKYSVKMGLYGLVEAALSLNVKLVLFGHTHDPIIKEYENIIFVNPGSPVSPRSGAKTYATIDISDARIHVMIKEIASDALIQELDRMIV